MPIERAVADDEPGGGDLPPVPRSTDFVIVTGMSGAGRSTAANVLEDLGWYVVDNLPPQLLPTMAELAERVAAGASTSGSPPWSTSAAAASSPTCGRRSPRCATRAGARA